MIALLVVEVVLFGVFLASDLLTKHYIMPYLEANGPQVLIDKVLTLTPAYNDGAGFSMLSGKMGWLIAITVVGLVLILGFSVYTHLRLDVKRKSVRFLAVVEVMMLAGGLGNLIDRIRLGYVRDFIDYTVVETLFHRSFAICNVADVWLTVGMILLIVYVIFFWRDANVKAKTAPQADPYAVATAERLMAADKEREVDLRQVTFKSPAEESAADGADDRQDTDAPASTDAQDGDDEVPQ